ncbi:MAG: glycosyltransferase [Candidatus Sumerlaeota bacterium]|nr:glycosyltransferase [Candidatus Sumerlaeota bacterium]
MRLLVLNHTLREQGTYFRAWPLARGLARRGWETSFVTVSPRRYYRATVKEEDGVRVIETPNWTWPGLEKDDGWGPLGILERLRLVLRERFDWVYAFAHAPNCYTPARWAVRWRGARLAVDWCDDFGGGVFPRRESLRRGLPRPMRWKWAIQRWAERHETKTERAIVLRAEKVTVISQTLFDKAISYGVAPERLRLIRSGADLEMFKPRPREEARAALGLPIDAPILSYVANYHPDEQFLWDALEGVFAQDARVKLLFTGPPFTDPRSRAPRYANRLIALGRVLWERVPLILAAGDACLVPLPDTPHNRARCPQKLMDCLAAGRPVVACAVGEVGRILQSHPHVGFAPPPAAEAYADSVLQALRLSPTDWQSRSHAAREAAEREFSWERAVAETDEFLRR